MSVFYSCRWIFLYCFLLFMNVTELARKLKVPTQELKEKLPELGFDIGMRAIKVDDRLARKIIEKWKQEEKRRQLEEKIRAQKERQQERDQKQEGGETVVLPPVISVRDLAKRFDMQVPALIAELMKHGIMASISDSIEYEIAAIVAEGLGILTEQGEADEAYEHEHMKHQKIMEIKKERQGAMGIRPPVVVVMGHVDHGKTKLLDMIRRTEVMEKEAGGITQHIGAYQVEKAGKLITFIDTPGHEAFSHMRSRGAVIADIAILVVAADDGVQPQTIEAIKMIQDAGLAIIVAINKIDKPEANIEKVKKQLAEIHVLLEGWGGEVPAVSLSAKQGKNIDELLEMILLVADLEKEKLQARIKGVAQGTIIESHVDKNRGPIATVLIHAGTLRVGDSVHVGDTVGKVRAMRDFLGRELKEALPSTPVQIIGLEDVAEVGQVLVAGIDLKKLKRELRKKKKKPSEIFSMSQATGKEEREGREESQKQYCVILKADVVGSLEAIVNALRSLSIGAVRPYFVTKGVGNITEIDVVKAAEAGAKIIGFNVQPASKVYELAKEKQVEIQVYQVVYHLLDKVKEDMEALVEPEIVRKDVGEVDVLKVFAKQEGISIVGGKITKGKAIAGSKFVLYRGEKVVGEGEVKEIRIGPDQHHEVESGHECGLKVTCGCEFEQGDILELYSEEEKTR